MFSTALLRNNDEETVSQFVLLLQYRLSHHQFCAYITLTQELLASGGFLFHCGFFFFFFFKPHFAGQVVLLLELTLQSIKSVYLYLYSTSSQQKS